MPKTIRIRYQFEALNFRLQKRDLGESRFVDSHTKAGLGVTLVARWYIIVTRIQTIRNSAIDIDSLDPYFIYCSSLIVCYWHGSQIWIVYFPIVVLHNSTTNQKSRETATLNAYKSMYRCKTNYRVQCVENVDHLHINHGKIVWRPHISCVIYPHFEHSTGYIRQTFRFLSLQKILKSILADLTSVYRLDAVTCA